MPHVNENSFHPAFLASLSVMELVALQHDLRTHPEDRENLHAVLVEIGRGDEQLRAADPQGER